MSQYDNHYTSNKNAIKHLEPTYKFLCFLQETEITDKRQSRNIYTTHKKKENKKF